LFPQGERRLFRVADSLLENRMFRSSLTLEHNNPGLGMYLRGKAKVYFCLETQEPYKKLLYFEIVYRLNSELHLVFLELKLSSLFLHILLNEDKVKLRKSYFHLVI
jgi:hypothetical protein